MSANAGLHSVVGERVVDALDKAIPKGEMVALHQRATLWAMETGLSTSKYQENGGFYRGSLDKYARVASYNNTRKDKEEILAWIERARFTT